MRTWLRPVLVPLLRRRADEVERQASSFRIESDSGRALVKSLGAAFLGGYNAMLARPRLEDVADEGQRVAPHFRPFFFEGAAMGYLPRGWWDARCKPARAERHLLELNPGSLYLYYVGFGFWYGFRHPKSPGSLGALKSILDPLYYPLCYDGFGFKLGFFDYPANPGVISRLDSCPADYRSQAYQGFGRSMFFYYMDDAAGFDRLVAALPARRRWDLAFGRSLATGFTGAANPDALVAHVAAARNEDEKSARLTGVTWAMAARAMSDPDYFETCLAAGTPRNAELLRELPAICDEERGACIDYDDWQRRTRDAVLRRYQARPDVS